MDSHMPLRELATLIVDGKEWVPLPNAVLSDGKELADDGKESVDDGKELVHDEKELGDEKGLVDDEKELAKRKLVDFNKCQKERELEVGLRRAVENDETLVYEVVEGRRWRLKRKRLAEDDDGM